MSYALLNAEQRVVCAASLEIRRSTYARILNRQPDSLARICLVGDRPGPSAPGEQGYHHTPFYSTKHCSGWLNSLLLLEGIPEDQLLWINSTLHTGEKFDSSLLDGWDIRAFVLLGGAAEQWARGRGLRPLIKVDHPQYWKRFKSSQRYPLLDVLGTSLNYLGGRP